jgi:multidrug efflux pump subunit AcrA (membrane-fusion protein)
MKQHFVDWWNKLPSKQHKLFLLALFVLTVGLGDLLVVSPAAREQRRLRAQIENINGKLADAEAEARTRAAQQQRLHDEEVALRQRLTEAEAQIASASKALVSPETLRARIRELTAHGEGVHLVELATLPIEPVSLVSGTPTLRTEKQGVDGSATLYRLSVVVVVDGSYETLRTYLGALEKTQLGLRWSSVALDNKNWPQVRMELHLFLLSDHPQWRGR